MSRLSLLVLALILAPYSADAVYDFDFDWYETGTIGDGWGDAVCTAGDVNGDGYSDILVGAPHFGDSPLWGQGKVYLYYGSATGPASTPDWDFTVNIAFGQIGWSVAPGGDMNGDGFADFVVGAPGHSGGNPSEGRLYFFLGGPSGPTWFTQAEVNEDDARLGHSVAYAGDVNGDGYDDVIAGAPGWGGFGSPFYIPVQGRAYVYYGGPGGPDGTSDWNRAGGDTDGEFGWSVAGLGDVNGDGYSDIMVGKPQYDPGIIDTDYGQVVCYYGSATGPSSSPDWTQTGAFSGDEFGRVVEFAGDFNGDGFADALIGVPDYNGGAGGVYIASGAPGGLSTAALLRIGYSSNWGGAVSNIGDFNGDSRTDFVVGGGIDDNAYIYFGNPLSGLENFIIGSNQFADVVGSAGDVNGDGLGDFMVVDPLDQGGAGSIRLYLGGREINYSVPQMASRDGNPSDELGAAMANAGDVDGDGMDDMLLGAPGASGSGEAQLYYGTRYSLSPTPEWTASGSGGGRFGASAAPAGDVNGDGYADIVVGDPILQEIHVFHGSPTGLATTSDWSHQFSVGGADFGHAVCGAGDLNGDGYADIAAGAPSYDGGLSDQGFVRVFFGSPAGILSSGYVDLVSSFGDAAFGSTLNIIGDANGDGFDDLAVGSPCFGVTGTGGNGRVSVYMGSATGQLGTVHHFDGTANGDQLGFSLAGGDLDGNGYADLVAGAPFADGVIADAGIVHVYFGGPTPFSTQLGFPASGVTTDTEFGRALAGLGDYDGQGRTLLVAARLNVNQMWTMVDVYELQGLTMVRRSAFEIDYAPDDIQITSVGDLDADGSPDLGYGLPFSRNGEGQARVYGPFPHRYILPPSPNARMATTLGDPIALRGILDAGEDLRFHARGWLPTGRTPLRLEWMIGEERQAYTLQGFGSWTPSATHIGGTDIFADHDGVLLPGLRYRWRVRVRSTNPFVPSGPWMTNQPNSDSLYGLRVIDTLTAADGAPRRGIGSLVGAFPNPFNPMTRLQVNLESGRNTSLEIFDVRGRLVRTLHHGWLGGGTHYLPWDGSDEVGQTVASGVYHARLQVGSSTSQVKLTVLK